MVHSIRCVALVLLCGSGIIAASALPAFAGFNLSNHCELTD